MDKVLIASKALEAKLVSLYGGLDALDFKAELDALTKAIADANVVAAELNATAKAKK